MARYQYALGTTESNLQYLFELKVKPPRQLYKPYSRILSLDDGTEKGTGWAVSEWYWAYLSDAEWTVLRTYCGGLSGEVYVRTLDEELNWHTYRAIMVMPTEPPDVENDARMKVLVMFKLLEQVD